MFSIIRETAQARYLSVQVLACHPFIPVVLRMSNHLLVPLMVGKSKPSSATVPFRCPPPLISVVSETSPKRNAAFSRPGLCFPLPGAENGDESLAGGVDVEVTSSGSSMNAKEES